VIGIRTAVITVVHGRHRHLALQSAAWEQSTVAPDLRCVVAIDDPDVAAVAGPDCTVVPHPAAGIDGLPLASARNRGAEWALRRGADLLIFLDVDCIPAPDMVERYRSAHRCGGPRALLSGPVTYLPPPPDTGYRLDALAGLGDPHPARPNPATGHLLQSDDYDLFWSLSFAVGAGTWRHLGGFCEDYVGYGAEDTDFAALARAAEVPLLWVGGAHAYHQYHPISDPPVEHLEAIVRNANIFRRRWGRWPMVGWLEEFENSGIIERRGDVVVGLTR
jgi:N-acetylglucosaminyl-diphospho-decaprenol L-rhamnosyltransferase